MPFGHLYIFFTEIASQVSVFVFNVMLGLFQMAEYW